MSASVLPWTKIEWGFQVELTDRWLAGCAACNWFPQPYFVEEIATADALAHNNVRHPGVEVVDDRNLPFDIANDAVKNSYRAMRFQTAMCIGNIAFLSLLSYLVFATWAFLPITIGWSAIMAQYGRRLGKSEMRHLYAMERQQLLTLAFLEARKRGGTIEDANPV